MGKRYLLAIRPNEEGHTYPVVFVSQTSASRLSVWASVRDGTVDLSQLSLPRVQNITYHYTCHLRGIGVKDEGVRLLKQIGNVDFRPMEKTDQCCGFGGTFAVKYPAISGAIVEDKVNCIADTKASTLICNDAGCTMNISGMCHRKSLGVRTKHIAELMAEAMGIDVTGW